MLSGAGYYSPRSATPQAQIPACRSDSRDGRHGASCFFSDDKVRNPL
jgi:hypothetical protein